MKVILEKLIAGPVAAANAFRTSLRHRTWDSSAREDKGVVRVLDHGTFQIIHEQMEVHRGRYDVGDHAVKEVGDDDEEVGAQGVLLANIVSACDPWPWEAIEQHSRAPSGEEAGHPCTPLVPEAAHREDGVERLLAHRVKLFAEVELQGDHGSVALTTALKDQTQVEGS
jgi:hypothetical protein